MLVHLCMGIVIMLASAGIEDGSLVVGFVSQTLSEKTAPYLFGFGVLLLILAVATAADGE